MHQNSFSSDLRVSYPLVVFGTFYSLTVKSEPKCIEDLEMNESPAVSLNVKGM